MAAIGTLLMFLSLGVFLWAVVGLIRPELAQLPNRVSSVGVWIFSVVLLSIGGALMPDDETSSPPQKEDEKGDLAQTIEGRGEERRAQDGGAVEGQEAEWTISNRGRSNVRRSVLVCQVSVCSLTWHRELHFFHVLG